MESSTNPKTTQQHELPKATGSEVTIEIWQDLLHTAIAGNGIFPQSFFAQGILLADKMANLVHEKKASLDPLLIEDPPYELTASMLEEAKTKSHSAYGFKSSHSMIGGGSIVNVWKSDKNQALDILIGFSEIIDKKDVDVPQESKSNEANRQHVLQKVFSNPKDLSLLLELLGVARQSLLSQATRKRSTSYKDYISNFMQKYSKHGFFDIPEEYAGERAGLMIKLYTTIRETIASIKEELVVCVERQHAQDKKLLERLKERDDDSLFGRLDVTNIHPLRNPDYE